MPSASQRGTPIPEGKKGRFTLAVAPHSRLCGTVPRLRFLGRSPVAVNDFPALVARTFLMTLKVPCDHLKELLILYGGRGGVSTKPGFSPFFCSAVSSSTC